MATDERPDEILRGLSDAGVELIVVGGTAAVLLGAPIVTEDLDIVHRRTEDNADRLLAWLLAHDAYHRFDVAKRRLPPTRAPLLGAGHMKFQTTLGKLDVLCELGEGEGYEEILADAIVLERGAIRIQVLGLERLIAVKASANRPKDRAALPVLIAALDEQRRRR